MTNGQTEDFTFAQVFWLAHAPVSWWGAHAKGIYEAIAAAGYKAMIPIDAWRMAMNTPLAAHLPKRQKGSLQ
jgi:hypothetical protein